MSLIIKFRVEIALKIDYVLRKKYRLKYFLTLILKCLLTVNDFYNQQDIVNKIHVALASCYNTIVINVGSFDFRSVHKRSIKYNYKQKRLKLFIS